jgi:membrane associated rhomboid family serine protease
MPACIECGTETPREEMRGAPDELRCPACAGRRAAVHEQPWKERPRYRESKPPVTLAVCAVAILVSLDFWTSNTYAHYLVEDRFAVFSGELWRLFTAIFPHVTWWHLAFNLYWFFRFGQILESWMGSLRFAGLVVLLAIGSSAADFILAQGGVGLSGVGYGLFGLLFALRRHKDFAAAEMQPRIVFLFVGWFFLCIVTTYAGSMHVANVAHGAGAILGWLVGRALLVRDARAILGVLAGAVVLLSLTCLYMPWSADYAWFQANHLYQHGDEEAALPLFEKAARAHPENAELQQFVKQVKLYLEQKRRFK